MPATRSTLTRLAVPATALVLAAGGLAACGGGSSSGGTGGSAAAAPAAAGGYGHGSAATGAAGTATVITATEKEFSISLPRTRLGPGSYTFVARNVGHTVHALEIDGPGVSGRSTGPINPGATARLTVRLSKGRYDVFCPVGNHRSLGMTVNVTVA
jgi:uncharacterized cupredoxin-like copper-binding protein